MATPPPKEDWETGKTAAQADAENVIGQQNRQDVGLSGYGGRSQSELNQTNYNTQVQQDNQRQQQQQDQQAQNNRRQEQAILAARASEMMRMAGYNVATGQQTYDAVMGNKQAPAQERTYLENLQNRPGYTDTSNLGDTRTQAAVKGVEMMRRMGFNVASSDEMYGRVLEGQRKVAEGTPGTRDDQFFLNELAKWNRTGIETSSEYHAATKATGEQQKANPYENWGDVALVVEKGGNPKDFTVDKYGFNPNVRGALGYTKPMKYEGWEGDAAVEQQQVRQVGGVLPEGKGLQETAWEVAKTRKAANVDFQPAIDYVNYQKGRMGPYGNLYGGVPDTTSNMPPGAGTPGATPVFDESGAKRPFVSANVPGQVPTGKGWNPMVVSAAEPTGYISEGVQIPNTTPKTETTWLSGFEGFQKNLSEKAYSAYGGLFGATGEQTKKYVENTAIVFETMANKNPVLIPVAYGTGAIKETLDQPVKAVVMTGIGFGTGLAFRGLTGASSIAVESAGTQFPKATKAFTLVTKAAPYVFGGLYATDVGIRSTEGGKDFGAGSIARNLGGISVTEIAPMAIGFTGGYKSPEIVRGGYEYTKTIPEKYINFKESIPTRDQLYYKYVELKTPGTAMNQPMPSERFITGSRGEGITGSNQWVEAQRVASRGSGTRIAAERGTVSGRPTPRQESLKLNYNPTAPLTEIQPTSPTGSPGGKIGGIRGSLRGKWDAKMSTEDIYANLPLKERWKLREGALSGGGSGYSSGGGRPTGNLQSGIGEGGSTVRSGRQYLDIRMPSSGLTAQESSLSPQQLEIIPSRRTAQRSRAFDMDFEYESRKLPEGMVRPGYNQGSTIAQLQSPTTESATTPIFLQGFELASIQKEKSAWIQNQFNERLTSITPDQINRQETRQKQEPVLIPGIDFTQDIIQTPRTTQIVIPRQDTTLIIVPKIPTIQIPVNPTIDKPWTNPPPSRPNIPENQPRIPTDIGVPFIPALPNFGGTGGYGTKRRPRKFTETFPIGLYDSTIAAMTGKRARKGKAKKGRLIPAKRAKKK